MALKLRNPAFLKLGKGILSTNFSNLDDRSWEAEHRLGSLSVYIFNQVPMYTAHLERCARGLALITLYF